ncbi:MAG: nitroreductase family protein [Eubacteriales bacterium]|nr:nitroreductase family protein [Eubacteriales bacterium]
MNEAIRNMMERRSCRSYKAEQIRDEELELILKAGEWAPSGMGAQSPMLVAVQQPELVKKLSAMNAAVMGSGADPFYGAPTAVVVFANTERPTYVEDGSLALGNMMNAAASLGVGSCWIHRAKEVFSSEEGKALKAEWGVPESYEGIGHCILGYASAPLGEGKPRKEGRTRIVK